MKHLGCVESFHMLQADGLNASRPSAHRAASGCTCSPITLKVHYVTVLADWRQAFLQLKAECVPKREFSKAFTTLLNSHASRTTGSTKPRVLVMSDSLDKPRLPRWGYMKASRLCQIVSYIPAWRSERKSTARLRDFRSACPATGERTTKRCLTRKGIETFA